jgi:drug/metabolite transporter (DMT)-like permease
MAATNPFFDAGLQVVAGGIVLLAMSFFGDDHSKPLLHTPRAVWSFVYLVTFGSVLAFSFYQYALKRLPVGVVTIYAYVNPLVAVLLGCFFGEPLTQWTALSFAGIVLGVYLVNRGYRQQVPTQLPAEGS